MSRRRSDVPGPRRCPGAGPMSRDRSAVRGHADVPGPLRCPGPRRCPGAAPMSRAAPISRGRADVPVPVRFSACSGLSLFGRHMLQEARPKARQTPVESDHAPFYCPNSLTFIVNLTGADSVSHRIIGQKHSDKQLQENNPTCKKTTPL